MPTMQLYSQKISSKPSWTDDKRVNPAKLGGAGPTSHIFVTPIKSYLSYILNEWYAGYSMENKFFNLRKEIDLLSKIECLGFPATAV
jgi:hypothetical protein